MACSAVAREARRAGSALTVRTTPPPPARAARAAGTGSVSTTITRPSRGSATGAVPAAVCRAYAELIGHWYRQAKTHAALGHQDLLQQTNGSTVTEYAWGLSGGFGVPKGVLQVLDLYRVPAA